MNYKLIYLFFLSAILFSCENDSKLVNEETIAKKKFNVTEEAEISSIFDDDKTELEKRIDEEMYLQIKTSDSIYGRTPFYFIENNDTFYYVADENWIIDADFSKQISKLGICNSKFELILPMNFEKISNPNITAQNYIEVKENGKYGLFNYKSNKLIPCDFDLIFPSNDEKSIAIGKINNEYFRILGQKEIILTEPVSYSEKFNLDSRKNKENLLHNSYSYYTLNDANDGTGVFFTPSFIDNLKILPEYNGSLFTRKEETFGTYVRVTLESVEKKKSFTSIINSFIELGVDGREYQIEKQRLTVLDSNLKFVDAKELEKKWETYNFDYLKMEFKHINDSIIMTRNIVPKNDYDSYNWMDTYTFYKQDKNGKLEKLKSNRIFNYTKYTLIDSSFFIGTFAKYLDEYNEGNMIIYKHLSIDDLDIMRNEIFADYGYRFQSEKWRKYFSRKAWYKPRYDNVDEMLTEIDKANIQVILKAKEKLQNNRELRESEKINYGMAG